MSVKLSIGTAVYNLDEGFLRAHVEGIIKQLTDETELLLIDDCSANNSGEVCKEYAAADSRVRYIRMEQNGGLSRVRNRTIAESEGKWIFFADGDDLLSDYAVETALRFCDSDYDIIIHDRLKFADAKQQDHPCELTQLEELPAGSGRELSISCLCLDPNVNKEFNLSSLAFFHAAWGALYNKNFLLKNDLKFPEGQKKAQDSVFNTEAYYHARKIAHLPYVMYHYRNNAQGITRRYSADFPEMAKSLIGYLRACQEKYYSGDADVESRFMNHRVISLVMDNMRLNIFHKDNPNSRGQKKKDFEEFAETEPYKTAINCFDAKTYNRPEWRLPVSLIKKKKFFTLSLFIGSNKMFRIVCGIDKKLFG